MRRHGEQQFVIFAAVQSAIQSRALHDRDRVNLRRDTGRHAQPVQIDRKAVAQIDAGRGEAYQTLTQRETRHDLPIPRLAKPAGNENRVADARAVTA
jgi:hypothetical protein